MRAAGTAPSLRAHTPSRRTVMRSPRGRVVSTTRPIALREGVVVRGRFPLLVVTLRVESRRNQRDVAFWAEKLGVQLRLVQTIAEGSVIAVEAAAAPDALERFVSFPFVQSYHLPVATRIGW